jgi:hypothetical protein
MAQLAALVCARIDAGSLDREDALDVQEIIAEYFGATRYSQLRDIWLRFQKYEGHSNVLPLYELAREWEKIVSEVSEDKGDAEEENPVVAAMADIIKALNPRGKFLHLHQGGTGAGGTGILHGTGRAQKGEREGCLIRAGARSSFRRTQAAAT